MSSAAQAASLLGHDPLTWHTKEPTWLLSRGVTTTYITQTRADAEVQPVLFRGELLKNTDNMVAF